MKKLLFLITIFAMSVSIPVDAKKPPKKGFGEYTYEDGKTYSGTWENSLPNGHGIMVFDDGTVYKGDFKDGLFDGHGTLTLGSIRYEGEFKDNQFNGHGTLTNADGSKYEGDWAEGKKHGHGTLTLANGLKYEGEFKDDQFNGHGTLTLADGDKYEGEFKDDKYHGYGIGTYADGSKYEGDWAEGKPYGHGTYTWADGSKYEGDWAEGKMHGHGTLTWADGEKYEGEFKDDKYHGHGTLTYADGYKYEGDWAEGKKHGQGTSIYADGSKFVGEFKEDYINNGECSKVRFDDDDDSYCIYTGTLRNGNFYGEGFVTYSYGGSFKGTFKDDSAINGFCTNYRFYNDDGTYETYTGQLVNGLYNGYGKVVYANGTKYEGQWVDGEKSRATTKTRGGNGKSRAVSSISTDFDEDLGDKDDLKKDDSSTVVTSRIYTIVEQEPQFPGGNDAFLAFISRNIRYPESAKKQGIQGKVVVRFVVLENGQVGDVEVTHSLDPACDREAVRVVKSLPRFIPGKQEGKPVKTYFTVPIRFGLY